MQIHSAPSRPPETRTPADVAAHPPLVDRFGRQLTYLRLAVNETCNLRCRYCMPAEGLAFRTGPQILADHEIKRLVAVAASTGMTRVRFTGGEPLLRTGLTDLVAATATTPGIESVHLTTNGLLLKRHATALRDAGLHAVNISLDTLRPDRYREMARRPALPQVREGLAAALKAGFAQVKVNVVALRGFNDDEIGDFVELTRDTPLGVRFIELMPFDAHQLWRTGRFVAADRICSHLQELYPSLVATQGSATEAHAFRVPGYAGTVSVIPAYSRSFCGACNRLRITADGKVLNCLFARQEIDLLGPMRAGADDETLRQRLREAVAAKPRNGHTARVVGDAEGRDSMTRIGG